MPRCKQRRLASGPWQELEERAQLADVESLLRRKLPQDRPELFAQAEQARGEEVRERRFHLLETLQMGNVAPPLDREREPFRRLVVPSLIRFRADQRIEGAI